MRYFAGTLPSAPNHCENLRAEIQQTTDATALADQWEMVGAQGFYYQGIPVERIDRVLARARMTPEDEAAAYDAIDSVLAQVR